MHTSSKRDTRRNRRLSSEISRAVFETLEQRRLLTAISSSAADVHMSMSVFYADGHVVTSKTEAQQSLAVSFSTAGITDLAEQADGDVLAAKSGSGDFLLSRHLADGQLDASFDGDGSVRTDFGFAGDTAEDLTIQADGRIMAVGKSGSGANERVEIARYNVDGSLDQSFSDHGKLLIQMQATACDRLAISIMPDGHIIGVRSGAGGQSSFRYASDVNVNAFSSEAIGSSASAEGAFPTDPPFATATITSVEPVAGGQIVHLKLTTQNVDSSYLTRSVVDWGTGFSLIQPASTSDDVQFQYNDTASHTVKASVGLTQLLIASNQVQTLPQPDPANPVLVTGSTSDVQIYGTLDLESNALVTNYSGVGSLANIRNLIMSGRNVPVGGIADATWDGAGIASSWAHAAFVGDGFESMSIAYALNSDLPLGAYSTFGGRSVDGNNILVRYTRNGDASLNGIVDDDDVTIVAALYDNGATTGHQWCEGDFNYDGKIDDNDVTVLAALYDQSVTPIPLPQTQVDPGILNAPVIYMPSISSSPTVSVVSTGEVDLSWADDANASSYEVYENTSPNVPLDSDHLVAVQDHSSYIDVNVSESTSYYYAIVATHADDSKTVRYASAATPSSDAAMDATSDAPSNLDAEGINEHEILLTWRDNSSHEKRFELQYSTDQTNWEPLKTQPAHGIDPKEQGLVDDRDVTYTVDGLERYRTYYFRVRAVNSGSPFGNHSTDWSNLAAANTLRKPISPHIIILIGGHEETARALEALHNGIVNPNDASGDWSNGVGSLWRYLWRRGYNVYLFSEYSGSPFFLQNTRLNEDGSGPAWTEDIFPALTMDLHGDEQDVRVIGYSHGGGVAYNLINRINAIVPDATITYCGLIDAVKRGLFDIFPPSPLTNKPNADYVKNYYETRGTRTVLGRAYGAAIPGADVNVNTTDWTPEPLNARNPFMTHELIEEQRSILLSIGNFFI